VGMAPPVAVLAFCLLYLCLEPRLVLFVVWAVSAGVTAVVGFLPTIARRMAPPAGPQIPAESGVHV